MLPVAVRFGTSSWAYEGWKGQVYQQAYPKTRFAKACLKEYAAFEYGGRLLFRTVGVDHSFYRPPAAAQWKDYTAQVPDDFRICAKVWEEVTIPAFAGHPRYGQKAGKANPRFLDAALCEELVLAPVREGLGGRAGPLIFEFQRFGLETESFLHALDRFLSKLSPDLPYAVEVRNPAILGTRYHDVLNAHGVAHVYNHWSFMPPLAEQHKRMARFTAPFTVLRLLTPLKMSYEQAKKRAGLYDKIVGELPEMRQDTIGLVTRAVAEQRQAYVLVNNRVEGNAPLTIQAIADGLSAQPSA